MADQQGDPEKQTEECRSAKAQNRNCPNIKPGYSDMESERYSCDVCGERYKLYDDDMR